MEAGSVGRRDPTQGARGGGAGGPGIQDPTLGGTGGAVQQRQAPQTADPGPLGLAAFALTTFVLSVYNSGALSMKGVPVVLGLALFYGGLVQLLAGMWEFRTGNTFGAVAFSSFGAFWLSFWAFNQFYAKETQMGMAGKAVAVYLTGWAFFTLYMFVASLRTTGAIALVFGTLAATFALLAVGEWTGTMSIVHAGGIVGLVTAGAAWYASFAAVVNSTFKKTVMPVVPLQPKDT